MSMLKLLLTSMLLVFAVSGVAAASAAAEEKLDFAFEGAKEGETEAISNESTKDEKPLVLEAEGVNEKKEKEKEPTIECSKDKIEGGVIKDDSPDDTIKALDFESCVDKSEATCEVPSIDTTELELELEKGANPEDTVEKIKPKSGTVIAEFKFKNKEGKECKEKAKTLRIEGDFITKEEDHEKFEKELPVAVEVSSKSEEIKYGDQPYYANFHLVLTDHVPRPMVLCRYFPGC